MTILPPIFCLHSINRPQRVVNFVISTRRIVQSNLVFSLELLNLSSSLWYKIQVKIVTTGTGFVAGLRTPPTDKMTYSGSSLLLLLLAGEKVFPVKQLINHSLIMLIFKRCNSEVNFQVKLQPCTMYNVHCTLYVSLVGLTCLIVEKLASL